MNEAAITAMAVVVGCLVLWLVYAATYKALYKRASADLAFVRTGQGMARVVIDDGAFVIGFLHAIKWISLETMHLLVTRHGRDALITKDMLRVDMSVEFYIRVEPREEQILRAARSFGDRSITPETVKQLVEAKLIGALRALTATKSMTELHTEGRKFEDSLHDVLRMDLESNGLSVEAVAITRLDRTDKSAPDPITTIDAESITERTGRAPSRRETATS